MRHEERWRLAEDLCTRMARTYPDDLIIGGVYGSTARATDTEWSDLELQFVVRTGSPARTRHFIYRGIAVLLEVTDQGTLEEILTAPSLKWPFYMGVLSVLKVLYGDQERVQAWLRLGQSVPQEKFSAALEAVLPELIVESYGRIFSCRERGNTMDIGHAVIEVLDEINQALCLLNGRWITHDYYQGFVDAFAFPKLPEDYRELVNALWTARAIEEIVPLATRLVGNFQRLLAQEGIRIVDFQSVDEVPL